MKIVFLGSLAVASLLVSMPLDRATAQRLREPTVDEQFRNQAPAELPGLVPPQPAQPIRSSDLAQPRASAIVGPAYLGVTFNTDDRDAVVRSVAPGSPAAQAGLQPHDVIESIQGRDVRTYQDVFDALERMRPGDMLDIEFSRRMNLRTQAALSSLPGASERTVAYPSDAPIEQPLPVPNNYGRASSSNNTYKQPTRYVAPQSRNSSASGQQRNSNNNQNGNNRQQDGGRGLLGRRRG